MNGGVDYGAIPLSSPPPLHITQLIHTQALWHCLSPGSNQNFIQSVGRRPIHAALNSMARQTVLPCIYILFGCQHILVQYKNRARAWQGQVLLHYNRKSQENDHLFPVVATYTHINKKYSPNNQFLLQAFIP